MSANQVKDLARRGARVRLEELRGEIARVEWFLDGNRGTSARRPQTGVKRQAQSRRRGQLSAAGRAAIVAAQKARWGKIKRANRDVSAPGGAPGRKTALRTTRRRRTSPAVRKAAAGPLRRYWAGRRK